MTCHFRLDTILIEVGRSDLLGYGRMVYSIVACLATVPVGVCVGVVQVSGPRVEIQQ